MVDRIRQLLQDKQLTPTQFADAIGVARPIISHILSGRNKPSLEVVQKILAAFAELSMPWLLNGTGPMWATAAPVAAAAPAVVPVATPTILTTAETTSAAASTSLQGDAQAAKPRRAPIESSAAEPTVKAQQPKTLQSAASLPVPRRFQAAATGRNKTDSANPATEVPQQRKAKDVATSEPAPTQHPAPTLPSQPAEATPASTPAPTAASDAAAAFLLQPGKAIRRIVIFYQDGSFADYQPE